MQLFVRIRNNPSICTIKTTENAKDLSSSKRKVHGHVKNIQQRYYMNTSTLCTHCYAGYDYKFSYFVLFVELFVSLTYNKS
ncbi:CLUMA_CG021671, isoform A [Clunio marinus]|uniref:CLUMA_CG021671, isoform A n=1 Tax=Clunio marinus TaxID=568069 RepID=A0A1J1J7F1_9DIPT|nr:CLUMA_CG021671, isoform A [Clunio marinus]